MKRVTVTFDFESSWGMPHDVPYDLASTTAGLLDLLDKYGAKAVFFACGIVVENHPDIILEIHKRGHEIGFHGYMHEHMHDLSAEQLSELATKLHSTADKLEALIGYRPMGFRAPYLMGPKFYDPQVYSALAENGFTWVSNREIRWPEELSRPDRLPWARGLWRIKLMQRVALVLLNLKLVLSETPDGKSGVGWLLGAQQPYARPEGLIEYPLYSPLDCDLVGFPEPGNNSGPAFTTYASAVLKSCLHQSRGYFNLNSHDWITGTGDRLGILESALRDIAATSEAEYFLPGLEGAKS